MINEILFMKGYGIYVWSAFIFTFVNFTGLYLITKFHFDKEKKRFIDRIGKLDPQRENFAKSQKINREILSNVSKI